MSQQKPVAVTGGTGFVGQAFLDCADDKGIALEALTRKARSSSHGWVEWVTGDLDDMAALERLCAGTSAVVHIAGLTNTPDTAEFAHANVTGTANVIKAAQHQGIKRFVFVSSLAAREPALSAYGASKAEAEELVKASGFDWTIVRPPAVYGPRDIDMLDLFRASKIGVIPLPPGGATSIIHVDDLAELLLALAMSSSSAAAGPVSQKIFEPDDGREGGWSHKELAKAIGDAMENFVFAPHLPRAVLEMAARADRLLRGKNAKLTPDRVGYMSHPNWVARFDRRVPDTLWQPRIDAEHGLKSTAQWYRKEGWL